MIHRRSFLAGVFSAFAAPAIVRASSLMPVKALAEIVSIDPLIIHPNPGPEMMALLKARIDEAQAVLARNLAENLFESYGGGFCGLDSAA